jgi:hypothetical protein
VLDSFGLKNNDGSLPAFWYVGEENFGDLVTPYLITKISGKAPQWCNKHCFSEYCIGVGSIMEFSNRNAVIWGTGIMFRKQKVKRPKKIHAVRGPISRERLVELGYDCPEIYGDPALLLPRYYNPDVETKYEIGVIPHYLDHEQVSKRIHSDKILVIDVANSVEAVVAQIKSCAGIVSSSLHGVIVSQAYGIPAVWVQFSNALSGDGTKFQDYFLSVHIKPYQGRDLSQGYLTEELLKECLLQADATIDIDLDQLLAVCPFLPAT